MNITHAKVSGLTNPTDPDLIGGEDWDAGHVVSGPVLVGVAQLVLTSGGAILSQSSSGFSSTFSKTGTGTYRANYTAADYNNVPPIIAVSLSEGWTLVEGGGSPFGVRWSVGNDGDDYIKLETIKESGTLANVDAGYLSLHAAAIFA